MPLHLVRQHSVHGYMVVKNQGSWFIAISHLLLLPPAIACLIVDATHNKQQSSCSDDYAFDLNAFLFIAGFWQVGTSLLSFGIVGVNIWKPDTIEIDLKLGILFYAPYVFWANVGFCIWARQLDQECRHEEIAQTLLAWCVVQLAMIPLIGLIFVSVVTIIGRLVSKKLADRERNSIIGDSEEQQDLVPDDIVPNDNL